MVRTIRVVAPGWRWATSAFGGQGGAWGAEISWSFEAADYAFDSNPPCELCGKMIKYAITIIPKTGET